MSTSSHTVLCGGISSKEIDVKDHIVELDMHGANPNVFLKISDISNAMARNMPDVLTDLLELATYIFSGDQAVGRGGARDTGKRWHRRFAFHVPVRCLDLWSKPEIKEALVDVLSFLSDDDYTFQFSKLQKSQPVQLYLENLVPILDAEEVILFSGGIDSLGGAIQTAIINDKSVALVSHRSAPKRSPQVADLAADLGKIAPNRFFHIPVWATKDEGVGREYTQRTRSFLYAALAAAVARTLGLEKISFYENGVTSINLPIAPQTVGGRSTRTTHPQSLKGFAKFFSLILDQTFTVESPFIWFTKGEVIKLIKKNGCAHLIARTMSCSRIVEATKLQSHCGRCSQCIDRRFATLAAGLSDDEDPNEMYKVDLMTGDRVVGESRTMAESFLRRALNLRTMNPLEFLQAYPEATRVLNHVGVSSEEAAKRIYELHRRHGEEVHEALSEGLRRHADEFQAGKLPDTCTLVLALPDRYRQQGADEKVPTFRLNDDHWEIWFDNESTTLKDGVGPRHLALLLGHPGHHFYAIDMLVAEAGEIGLSHVASGGDEPGDATEDGFYIRRSPSGSAGKATDKKARKSFRVRLDEIEVELGKARDAGNPELILELQQEEKQILQHISSVIDLRGKPRPTADDDERARSNVSKAISRTIDRLWKKHPGLARHLGKSLTKGVIFVYAPDPPISWITY